MTSLYKRRIHRPRIDSRHSLLLALRVVWVCLVIWCEFGVFFYSLSSCKWPDKVLSPSGAKPTRVLLLADVRLPNPSFSMFSSWLGYNSNTAYLRKGWKATSRLNPDAVIFLGDTFASGRYVTSETAYDQYCHAFEKAFPRNASLPFYLIPGNNDIGLGDSSSFSKDARLLFEKRFGPLNRVVSISGHQFVLLDAPGLVEEDYRRHGKGETYDHWTPLPGGPIEFVQSISGEGDDRAMEPKILLTHIPLSRPWSKSCGPLRESGSIRPGAGHGYQAMLGRQTTEFLLKTLRPSVVFSADNRDYCEVTHDAPLQGAAVRELLSLIPPSSSSNGPYFADAPCHLPDTRRVLHAIYVPCFILTALVLLYLNIRHLRHGRHLSEISPISLVHHRRTPSRLELESAIWTSRTPLKSRLQTSPTAPFPLSSRVPSSKSVPSYRASPMSSPQSSPLLSPITLFPSGDEGDTEEDPIRPSHYNLRRELPYSSGWDVEHHHDQGDDDEGEDNAVRSHHARDRPRARVPHFLPPPLPRHARSRWAFSWSFVLRGRRRQVTLGLPSWRAWHRWVRACTGRDGRGRGRGLVWRYVSDCVSVGLPAVVVWALIDWLVF